MLEIALIIVISKKIAVQLRKKGRSPAGYIALFVLLWLGGEIVGALVGTVITVVQNPRALDSGFNFTAYILALIGAAVGGSIGYIIARVMPPIEKPRWDGLDDYEEDYEADRAGDWRHREPLDAIPVDEPDLPKPAGTPSGSEYGFQTRPSPVPPPQRRPDIRLQEREWDLPTAATELKPSPVIWIVVGVAALAFVVLATGLAAVILLWPDGENDRQVNDRTRLKPNAKRPPNVFADPRGPRDRPPPRIENPAPIRPEAPKRPAFDDRLATNVALQNGRFEMHTRFEDEDPADRNTQHPAKIFLIDLEADQAYLGELSFSEPFVVPALRLEDRQGRTLATSPWPPRQGPAQFVFFPTKTDTYRLVASTRRASGEFTLSLRRVEEGDPLPDIAVGGGPAARRSIQVARKLDLFLSAAIAPDSRSAWVSWPDKRLTRIACPEFDTKATYKLPKRSYRIAVDGRGMLYAVAQLTENQSPLPLWDFGIADLEIYDTNKLNNPGAVLKPTKTISVRGIIKQLCMSPDDAWIYYLDVHNRKIGRVNLREGKLDGETDQLVPDTNSLCLTPNGTKLYTCSSTNAVQIFDPATLKVEKTIRIHEANPTGIQATDKGYVFLNSGNGQWTHIYLLYAARDYKDERAPVIPWAGVYHTNALALSPDQQCLYASCFNLSPSNIKAFHVSARPTMIKGRECGAIGLDAFNTQGQMIISRDGRFMFCDRGVILSLGR
jgi:hypothetical protein